jgi:hypothetical protein
MKRALFSIPFFFLLGITAQSARASLGGPGGGGGEYPDFKNYFRLNCRYHNQEQHHGAHFCYASAVYRFDPETSTYSNLHLGVGCDHTTLYNDDGYLTVETTLDRLSPLNSAVPGVEVFPQGQLSTEGTYTSMLDIPFGRMQGLCYVRYLAPGIVE